MNPKGIIIGTPESHVQEVHSSDRKLFANPDSCPSWALAASSSTPKCKKHWISQGQCAHMECVLYVLNAVETLVVRATECNTSLQRFKGPSLGEASLAPESSGSLSLLLWVLSPAQNEPYLVLSSRISIRGPQLALCFWAVSFSTAAPVEFDVARKFSEGQVKIISIPYCDCENMF